MIFLDAQLYLKNIGVEIISNLITNLIQDVLSEYTKEKLQSLNITDKLSTLKFIIGMSLQSRGI